MDATAAIDELWHQHTQVRDVFPPVREEDIGSRQVSSGEWFKQQGLGSTCVFDRALTKEDVSHLNSIAHWLNQSLVIRLVATLKALHIRRPSENDGNIAGRDDIEIAFDLRDVLDHASDGRYKATGKYGPDGHRKEQMELYERISTRYGLNRNDADIATEWCLPIDRVLKPMVDGCRNYVAHWQQPLS